MVDHGLIGMINKWEHRCTPKTCSPCVLSVLYNHAGLANTNEHWKQIVVRHTNLIDSLSYFNEDSISLKDWCRKTIYSQIMQCCETGNSRDRVYIEAVNSLQIPEMIKKYILNNCEEQFRYSMHYRPCAVRHRQADLI